LGFFIVEGIWWGIHQLTDYHRPTHCCITSLIAGTYAIAGTDLGFLVAVIFEELGEPDMRGVWALFIVPLIGLVMAIYLVRRRVIRH
jgi:hypothetical protein